MKLPYFPRALAALLLCAAPAGPALSHGGPHGADGCHQSRKTGEIHCHRGGGSSAKSGFKLRSYGVAATYGGAAGLR